MGGWRSVRRAIKKAGEQTCQQAKCTIKSLDAAASKALHQTGKQLDRTSHQITEAAKASVKPKQLVKNVLAAVAIVVGVPPSIAITLSDARVKECNHETVRFKDMVKMALVVEAGQAVGNLTEAISNPVVSVVANGVGQASVAVASKQDPVVAFISGTVDRSVGRWADASQFSFAQKCVAKYMGRVLVSVANGDDNPFLSATQQLMKGLVSRAVCICADHKLKCGISKIRELLVKENPVVDKARTRYFEIMMKRGSIGNDKVWIANFRKEMDEIQQILEPFYAHQRKLIQQLKDERKVEDEVADMINTLSSEAQVLASIANELAEKEASIKEWLNRPLNITNNVFQKAIDEPFTSNDILQATINHYSPKVWTDAYVVFGNDGSVLGSENTARSIYCTISTIYHNILQDDEGPTVPSKSNTAMMYSWSLIHGVLDEKKTVKTSSKFEALCRELEYDVDAAKEHFTDIHRTMNEFQKAKEHDDVVRAGIKSGLY